MTEKSYAANGYESEIEPAEGDITDGAQSVTVTNTMNVGDLSVSKTVNGSGAQARREFTFTLTLENADGVTVDNTYTTSEGHADRRKRRGDLHADRRRDADHLRHPRGHGLHRGRG